MNKIIIEVGSTCVKIDRYNGNNIERLDEITIQFKKHYNENNHLMEDDIKELIKKINDSKCISKDIYVCGTSIFRTLSKEEKEKFDASCDILREGYEGIL